MRKEFLLTILTLAVLAPTLVLASHRTNHPANLQDSINTPNFNYTVYYTNDNPPPAVDSHYFTTAQAQLVANAIDTNNAASPANPGHHQLFMNLGFNAPFFNPAPPEVYIYNSTNLGGAYFAGIDIDAPSYRNAPEIDVRLVTGHELFHHVQYNYINDGMISGCSTTWGQWTCEATARLMQDKVYADLDADPGTVQASYPGEISNYLTSNAQLNTTLTSQEYKAALFWNYLTEQLGTVNTEPQRGVDVIQAYWQNASANTASPDPFGVLRTTINQLQPGLTLEEVWHNFIIANYAKDLNVSALLSDASKYQYIDDNATAYAQVTTLIDSNFPPTIGPTASSVNSFATRYYVGRPSAVCDIIGFQSTGDQAAYGLLAVTGTDTVARLYQSVTTDFAKALINRPGNPYTRLVAVVGGLNSAANYSYTFACGDASLEIVRPNTNYRAFVGEPDDPERFLIIVNVAGPPELGTPSVQGLDVSDFQAFVGPEDPANEAIILSGAYVQGSYWLVAQAPVKDAAGTYPLLVKLGELAADTEEGVVEYTKVLQDQVLVIDASGSMNFPAGNTKLDAAKNAGRLFVDVAALDDQLGIVWFSGNGIEPDNDAVTIHQLQPVLGQRNIAKGKIDAILPQNLTSIGDGLNEGQSEIDARGGPEGQDVIVLLSDGLENEAEFWADIQAAITGAGTVVHAIALGPTTDQAKMQEIATATGGDYLYVDLTGASLFGASSAASATTSGIGLAAMPLPNRLANSYRLVNETIHRWQRLWENAGTIVPPQEFSTVLELPINVEEGGLTEPIFSLNWAPTKAGIEVTLLRPDGIPVESGDPGVEIFEDPTHKVYQLDEIAQLGTWILRIEVDTDTVDYVASLSAKNVQGVQLDVYLGQFHFDPVAKELERPFLRGLPMPIIATLTDIKGPIIGADVLAEVEHPDGKTDRLQLFDDGNHGDGDANDGIYANIYHRTTAGSTVGVDDRDEDTPGTRGSYVVSVGASGNSNGGELFERHKGSSFQLFEFDPEKDIGPEPDQDQDRLPDRWEQLHPCVNAKEADADADPDEDQLTNADEFAAGTDPCDPDTDDGGEADGSEVKRGANPLEPQDDEVPFPVDVEVFVPGSDETTRTPVPPNSNLIRFSAGPQVDTVLVFRSTSPTGPFELVATLDPTQQRGMYLDEGLENGTTYYYRLQLVRMNGFSPFSRVFSGTPREEPYPPRGSVLINGGATYAESTNASLTLNARKQLFTPEPPPEFTAEGLEMIISNSPDFTAAVWEPFQPEKTWSLAPDPDTEVAIVYVKYRDEQGLESPIETDGIRVMPSGSLGSIKGKGLLEGQTDHTGILVMAPDNPLVQATFTTEAGDFLLADLLPGQYNLSLTRPSYLPQEVIGVTVNTGEVTDIGTITLVREEPIEVDFFPNSTAQIEIEALFGSETVTLTGPTEVHVFIGPDGEAMDTDGDGRDQVQTEIVAMELSGTSSLLGPITVRLRDPALHPFQRSRGEIEENFDAHTGTLDLPPFTPSADCAGGCTADSLFDVFFEIEVGGQVFHTHDLKRMEATITQKPPAEGETYENFDVIELFDENEDPTGIKIARTFHTPNPGPPTAIELSSFTAESSAESITLTWETVSELDNEGFNLWRAEAADGEYTQINPSLIPAQGNPDTGANYEYVDGDVAKGVTYYYKLEDVDIHGVSTFHGPVSATAGPYRSIYLPLILK